MRGSARVPSLQLREQGIGPDEKSGADCFDCGRRLFIFSGLYGIATVAVLEGVLSVPLESTLVT